MEVKKFKEAKAQFERGLNVLKAYPKGNYLFGKAALAMKEYPVALKAAADERKLYPNLVESYILAGEVYTETQDFKKCALELQEAIRILPKGTNNYIKLAQCLAWSDSLEAAESMITIATSQDSGIADIYKVQGYIFEKQGQSQEAAQAYEKYITMAPMAVDKKLIEDRIKQLER
jgi:tetratricopeptide (TPR) repeat protein